MVKYSMEQTPQLQPLNYKRTIYISFAFFMVLMLFFVYNFYAPLFLGHLLGNNRGQPNEGQYTWLIGLIMSIDNILALLILPVVGIASDRTKTRLGKRSPYIFIGAALTVILFPLLPVLFILNSLWGLIVLMGLVLLTMNIVRGPAVALMPDITPKPHRSKANAIINLTGYVGAILGGIITMFVTSAYVERESATLLVPFVGTSVVMIFICILLYFKVKENKFADEVREQIELGEKMAETQSANCAERKLTRKDKINLWIMFTTIFFLFFSFNAMETFWSTYGHNHLGTPVAGEYRYDGTPIFDGGPLIGLATIVLAITSMITFIPAGFLSKKIGRKKSVIIGILVMMVSITPMIFATTMNAFMLIGFAGAGAGWAIAMTNVFPMLAEFATPQNVGKYTGYYYIASQLAMAITTLTAGLVIDFWLGNAGLLPYTVTFMGFALISMLFFQMRGKKELNIEQQNDII